MRGCGVFFAGGSGTAQTLDEMAFERGVWTAAIDGDSSRYAWPIYYFTNKITLPLTRLFVTDRKTLRHRRRNV